MLGILAALIGLDFGRAPLWLVALALGAAGVRRDGRGDRRRHARGPRRVAGSRSCSRCRSRSSRSSRAARSPTALYDVIRVVSAAFPFRPALQALDAAVSGGELLAPLLHLAALTLAFGGDRAGVAAAVRVTLTRKALLARTGAVVAAGAIAGCASKSEPEPDAVDLRDWDDVRGLYPLATGLHHLNAFLLAPHTRRSPRRSRATAPGSTPTRGGYLAEHEAELDDAVAQAAAAHLGARADGDRAHRLDHDGARPALRRPAPARPATRSSRPSTTSTPRTRRCGCAARASRRDRALYRRAGAGERRRDRRRRARGDRPAHARRRDHLGALGHRREAARRASSREALPRRACSLCVDAVHALGVEAAGRGLGCDFLVAGTHKWLAGPRGTGIVWARAAWEPRRRRSIPPLRRRRRRRPPAPRTRRAATTPSSTAGRSPTRSRSSATIGPARIAGARPRARHAAQGRPRRHTRRHAQDAARPRAVRPALTCCLPATRTRARPSSACARTGPGQRRPTRRPTCASARGSSREADVDAALGACAADYHRLHGLPRHPPAPPARDHRPARPRARDRAGRAPPRLPDVRGRTAQTRRTPIPSMPGIDHLSIAPRGRRRRARPPRSASRRVLLFGLPARQGRGGLGRVGRRGRRPARHARDQGRPPRPAGDHRPVPVRVHEPRPLRRAARRRRRRQRRDARAARPHRRLPGRARAPTPSRRAT